MHGHSRTMRTITKGFAAAIAVFTVSMGLAPKAQAGIPTPWEVHKRIHEHVDRRIHQLIDIPRRIHSAHVREFHNFYSGRSYYGPHRHFHVVYRFPVYVGSRVIYRPYTYCNEDLFVPSSVVLPRLSVRISPGSPVYYGPPAVYAQPPVYIGERYDHDRNDHDHGYDRDRYHHDDRDDHWDD